MKDTFFKQMWDLQVERYRTRKALRELAKQEWSVEFLTAMLVRAANVAHQPLEMTITNGQLSLKISTISGKESTLKDDNIFDHLDDDVKIRQFIDTVGKI